MNFSDSCQLEFFRAKVPILKATSIYIGYLIFYVPLAWRSKEYMAWLYTPEKLLFFRILPITPILEWIIFVDTSANDFWLENPPDLQRRIFNKLLLYRSSFRFTASLEIYLSLKGQFHSHTVIFKGMKITFRKKKIEKKTIPR